ncbi:MAG: ATP-binding cassette domain-containing protein [Edaphobacter sp.]
MSERAHLEVQFRHRVGALEMDVAFTLREPWTVLFGPSGSGKTTALRVIAGFVRPDAGRIASRFSEGEFVMTDTSKGIFLKPHERLVRTAGQGAALFPHLSVRRNVAFGAQAQTNGSSEAAIVDEAIERFRLQTLTEKVPSMLSGGERQRVAIARAATAAASAGSGCVLLLDEPFTGQDAPLRDELIEELRKWLVPMLTPILSVTHDVGEAFQLGAEVIKMADGRIVQQGPAADVLAADRARLLEQLRTGAESRA